MDHWGMDAPESLSISIILKLKGSKEIPMPRKPKMYLPGLPSHVVQRGNDRNPASSKKTIMGSAWIAWVMHASDTPSLFMPMY
jgi:hypothetical protein